METMGPKILSPAEALRALADGHKIRRDTWRTSSYLYLSEDMLVDESGRVFCSELGESLFGFELYTEPRPKRRVAPYIVRIGGAVIMTVEFYSDDKAHALTRPGVEIIRRVTELETGVE